MSKLLMALKTTDGDRKYLLEVVKVCCIGILLIAGELFGAYLFAIKSKATSSQQNCGCILVTAIAFSSAGYILTRR